MAARDYIIYTLNAFELMKICRGEQRRADLTSAYDRDHILLNDGKYGDSELNTQILRAIASRKGEAASPDDLTEHIVYLNFGKGLVDDFEEDIMTLLDEGFSLRFSPDGGFVRFVPLDKSASMARENTISFISSEIFEEVDEAIGLGIDWTSFPLVPSKYYAYRGLAMSDGIKIEDDGLVLNQKTVIVVSNESFDLKGLDLITVSDPGYGPIPVNPDNITHPDKMKVTPYDGEGLISPEYRHIIARNIRRRRKAEPVSFQIRMPFSKGMLHSTDFRRFFKEQFPEEKYEDIYIEDFFGIKRRLADAEIILTDSMFKCGGWLKKYLGVFSLKDKNGKKVEVLDHYTTDPMRFYFEQFSEYGHSMYVVRTDTNLRNDGRVSLSYQFLNTLDLTPDSLRKLVRKHSDESRKFRNDPMAARNLLIGRDDDSEWDIEPDSYQIAKIKTWEYALTMNPAFIRDPLISSRLVDAEKARIKDIYRGRITCEGSNKFLSGDLLSLMINMAGKASGTSGSSFSEVYEDRLNRLKSGTIKSDRFYMPLRKGESLNADWYYGLLRNPHLSRNEECALRPQMIPLYNKYFSQLKDVIMVSDKSAAPAILGGADFDGDIIKFIRDRDINSAILRGAYTETEPFREVIPRINKVIEHRRFTRRLPIACIVSPGANPVNVGRHISYQDLKNAFSSTVGKISNAAVSIGKMEYWREDAGSEVPENITALCTIATGLEIDSVKTGRKPDTSLLLSIADGYDDCYLKIDRKLKDIASDSSRKNLEIHAEHDTEADSYETYFKRRVKDKSGSDRETIFTASEDVSNNIDRLPYYYAEALADYRSSNKDKSVDPAIPKYCFDFEMWDDWRDTALSDQRASVLEGYIGAYRKLIADSWKDSIIAGTMKRGSLKGFILTLLFTEYDRDNDRLPQSDEEIADAVDTAYQELYRIITSVKQAEETLNRMKERKWQFVLNYSDRGKLMKEILASEDFSAAAMEIICDSYDNGYQILYYILSDIMHYRKEEDSRDKDAEQTEGRGKWGRALDEKLYKTIYSIYSKKRNMKRNNWTEEVSSCCREAVKNLFDGDMEQAVRCTIALDRKVDEKHGFLWNVYTIDDIRSSIYMKPDPDGTGLKRLAAVTERSM